MYTGFVEPIVHTVTFVFLLLVYLCGALVKALEKFTPAIIKNSLGKYLYKLYVQILNLNINSKGEKSINRINLIGLAMRNMLFKRMRSLITIGGMAVGIGAIVFLVSLGYGLQELVISRVAKLNEIKQINIASNPGSKIDINDKSLADFKQITGVEQVFPVISVVGKVNFNESISDMVVYGVVFDYLDQSSIKTVKGKIFESNDVVISAENLSTLDVNTAEQSVPDAGRGTKDAITTDSDGWVYIASESDQAATVNTKIVVLPPIAKREAVVNRSMLRVLGIDENDAVGKRFTSAFVATGDLLPAGESKIESSGDEYLIVGVVPGDKTPIFYVPFIDLRSMGIVNYSQATIVANHDKDVADIRKKIEAMGYATSSVVDTIDQINSLFSTVRVMLGLLGTVALAVASLGMFNTLTVSLLERTREVGLMKTMGMKSNEVRELFLTESMTMGFFGGVIGILLGYIGGKLLGLILSVFSLTKGLGFLDITYIPSSFILLIIFLSLLVGIFTGIYPAKRATRISALDALRYE